MRKIPNKIKHLCIVGAASVFLVSMGAAANAQSAPVSLTIESDKGSIEAGGVVTYKIIIRSTAQESLSGVTVTSRLPELLVPLATAPEASLDSGSRTITWDNITIQPGAHVELGLRAQAQFTAPAGRSLDYGVTVATDTGEMQASHAIVVIGSDSGIEVAGVPSPVSAKTGAGITPPLILITVLLPPMGLLATRYYLQK